jgi:hypothetical protein
MPDRKRNPDDERECLDRLAGEIGAPACDLQRINHAAKRLNSEATDVLDYQSLEQ